jgi:multiple sugar transport system permease protein
MRDEKMRNKLARQEALWAYLFIAPLLIGLIVFYYFATFQNIYYSFTDLGPFGKPNVIGLKNYKRLLGDEKFYRALIHTIKYVVVSVPAIVIFSTLLATLLNAKINGRDIYRTLIFIPAVTMPAAIGLLWRWLYNYEYGLINMLFRFSELEPVAWLSDTRIVLYAIAVVLVWSMVSYQMIIVLAGLQGISPTYYEAAEIDGAGKFQQFFSITLPLLTPTLFFITVISIINVFQIFDFIFLMIDPRALSMQYAMSLVYYFFDRAFIVNERGYAAAISLALFVIILAVTIVQFKLQKKWVHYES